VSDTANSLQGVAVTGAVSNNHGTWQYSINGGITWLAFPSVSATAALLLRSTDKVRFNANPDYNGTSAASFTYSAWDQTYGSAGSTADVSSFYSGAFFSTVGLTATLDV